MLTGKDVVSGCLAAILGVLAGPALANSGGICNGIPSTALSNLKSALKNAVGVNGNGGLGFNMWGTIVDSSGIVCAVAFSGSDFTSQWLGSRVISAQKANTANAFSLTNSPSGSLFSGKGLALSTANLFTAVQPGGSLYGLQASNPVDTDVAYGNQPGIGPIDPPPAPASSFGTQNDPLVGQRVGGVNVFGGGLGLYLKGVKVGGLGVSGDTSCTDHMVAWRTRHALGLDQFGSGVTGVAGGSYPDNIIFDITANQPGGATGGTGVMPNGTGGVGTSASGFGHPMCLNNPTLSTLPAVQ
jgi:hypothetical protein